MEANNLNSMFQKEWSDLGPYCLQYWLPKNISREEKMTKVMPGEIRVNSLDADLFCMFFVFSSFFKKVFKFCRLKLKSNNAK